VDSVGAQFTNIRADRVPAPAVAPTPPLPAPAPIPPAPAACTPAATTSDARIDQLATELHDLRLQIQVLTQILKAQQ
jgi:hypothetical protein